jgi:calcineurin-like phosphoesterase family protein
MNYLVHTDLHLGHEKVLEFEPERIGFEQSIKHTKHYTNKDDVLINLGDIGFKDKEKWLTAYCECTEAKKILVKGNHCRNISYTQFYRFGFDFVCEQFSLYIYGTPIIFSHKPIPIIGDQVNIHGHFHKVKSHHDIKKEYPFYSDNHILVDTRNDCKPVNLKKLLGK